MKRQIAPLSCEVADGQLVVRIGVETLALAVAAGSAFHQERDGEHIRNFAITDPLQFAKDIANELQREDEDGSSPLTDVIDQAAQSAIDEGSLAIKYEQQIRFYEHAECETWWPKSCTK